MVVKKSKKRQKQPPLISKGKFYIKATFNNTFVSVTDSKGNVLCWESSGSSGFKGARKSTPPLPPPRPSPMLPEKLKTPALEKLKFILKDQVRGETLPSASSKLRVSKLASSLMLLPFLIMAADPKREGEFKKHGSLY